MLSAWFTIPAEIEHDHWYLTYNTPRGRVISIRPGLLMTEQKAGFSVRSDATFDRGDIEGQTDLVERHFGRCPAGGAAAAARCSLFS